MRLNKHDDHISLCKCLGKPCYTVAWHIHGETTSTQTLAERPAQTFRVFHYQQSHRHGRVRPRFSSRYSSAVVNGISTEDTLPFAVFTATEAMYEVPGSSQSAGTVNDIAPGADSATSFVPRYSLSTEIT